jgi:histidinol-phosphate phosphatase family protein
MRAALVAGGRGLRMGAMAADLPKPMLPFGGRPLLAHQVALAAASGLREVVVLAGHGAQVIADRLAELAHPGVRLSLSVEARAAGSGGCLRQAPGDQPLLVIFGDILVHMDLGALLAFHRESGACATAVVHPNDHPHDSDLVEIDARRRIVAIHRKPHRPDLLVRNRTIAGVFVLEPELLRRIPRERPADLVHDVLIEAVGEGLPVAAYETPEYLKDIGTPERYRLAAADWERGLVVALHRSRQRPAAFLDRDGTINRHVGLLVRPEQLELLPGAAQAIRRLNREGIRAIVVTNQPVVARGLCDEAALEGIHARLEMELGKAGAYLDAIYVCPHHPDAGFAGEAAAYKRVCDCRKPATGMIEAAARDFALDLSASALFGDSARDMEAARRAGLAAYLVGGEPVEDHRGRRAGDLAEAVDSWLGKAAG